MAATVNTSEQLWLGIYGDDQIYISDRAKNSSVLSYAGNERIINYAENVFVSTWEGRNTITNHAANVIINTATDNDRINNYEDGGRTTVWAGEGNDTIYNDADNAILHGGAGDDYLYNDTSSENVKIFAESGSNYVANYSDNVLISVGAGNDSIYNHGEGIVIYSADGKNSITSQSSGSVIISGAGTDFISLVGTGGNTIAAGVNGFVNNTIEGFNVENDVLWIKINEHEADDDPDKIYFTVTEDSVRRSEDEIEVTSTVTFEGGSIRLVGAAGELNIQTSKDIPYEEFFAYLNLDADTTAETISTENFFRGRSEEPAIIYMEGAHRSTIFSGIGADSVKTYDSDEVWINTDGGNDTIKNFFSWNVSISAGNGDDSIYNASNSFFVSINGDNGADSISNYGNYSTVNAGAGDDSVRNSGFYSEIDSGEGNDTVRNYGDNSSVNLGAGDDSFVGAANNAVIYAGAGNDSLQMLSYGNATIFAGEGTDSISNSSNYALIFGEEGQNEIFNFGHHTTIFGGTDGDSIHNSGITGSNVGMRTQIHGGAGANTLSNSAENVMIFGGDDADSIYNFDVANVAIYAGEGDNTVSNRGDNVIIYSGAGNDYIYNSSSAYHDSRTSINAGDGNNTITAYGKCLIITGAGNDYIANNSTLGVTLSPGLGNNTINHFQSEKDILCLPAAPNNVSVNSFDTLIEYDGGSVLIANSVLETVPTVPADIYTGIFVSPIKDEIFYTPDSLTTSRALWNRTDIAANLTIMPSVEYSTVNCGEQGDIVDNYGSSILIFANGGDDDIVSYHTATIYAGYGDDYVQNVRAAEKSLIIAEGGDNTLYNFGTQTTLWTSDGVDSVLNSSLAPETFIYTGAGNDTISNSATKVTIYAGEGNDTIYNQRYGTQSLILAEGGDNTISNAARYCSIFAGNGADSIYSPYSRSLINLGDGNNTVHAISEDTVTNNLIICGAGDDSIQSWGNNTIFAGLGANTVEVRVVNPTLGNYVSDVLWLPTDAYTVTTDETDTLIEYDGGFVKILNFTDAPNIITGGDEIYQAILPRLKAADVERPEEVVVTAQTISGEQTFFEFYDNAVNVLLTSYAAGSSVISGEFGDSVTNNFAADVFLYTDGGNDTLDNQGANVSIYAGTGNDTIRNTAYAENSIIDAGEGDDTIRNVASNSIIFGHLGDDSIYNNGANSTISAFDGNDYVSNYGVASTLSAGEGDDTLYNWDSGRNVWIGAENGNNVIRNWGMGSTINAGAGNDSIYATKYAVVFAGNGNNTIECPSSYSLIIGGADADYITLPTHSGAYRTFRGNGTINAGTGFDTIEGFVTESDVLWFPTDAYNITNDELGTLIEYDGGSIRLTNVTSAINIVTGEIFDSAMQAMQFAMQTDAALRESESISTAQTVWQSNDVANLYLTADAAGSSIFSGAFGDIIDNYASDVFISTDGGNDTINSNGGSNVTFNTGDGSDTVRNYSSDSVIFTGTGNDTVYNFDRQSNVAIFTEDGDDVAYNYGTNVTMIGGAGNDSLRSGGSNVVIHAEDAGDDLVSFWGRNATIYAGNGDDSIYNFHFDLDVLCLPTSNYIMSTPQEIVVEDNAMFDTLIEFDGGKAHLITNTTGTPNILTSDLLASSADLWGDESEENFALDNFSAGNFSATENIYAVSLNEFDNLPPTSFQEIFSAGDDAKIFL